MRKTFIRTCVALLLVFALLAGTTAFAESATVVGSAVNLRSGPGTNYQVLDTLIAGTVVEVTKHDFSVRFREGALRIKELQPEGKKRMTSDAFLRGYDLKAGDVFTKKPQTEEAL